MCMCMPQVRFLPFKWCRPSWRGGAYDISLWVIVEFFSTYFVCIYVCRGIIVLVYIICVNVIHAINIGFHRELLKRVGQKLSVVVGPQGTYLTFIFLFSFWVFVNNLLYEFVIFYSDFLFYLINIQIRFVRWLKNFFFVNVLKF